MSLEVRKQIEIHASPDAVFDALTDPLLIVRCYPVERVELEPNPGGAVTIHGTVGDEAFTDYGTVEKFDRPHAFRYRYWSTNHGTEQTAENQMTIAYRIESTDADSLMLHLHHGNLLTADRTAQMSHVWDHLLAGLKGFVEGSGGNV